MANERILPSKTQMINFIKLVRRKDEKMNEINKTILHDLEEALNIDLEEKQAAILQGLLPCLFSICFILYFY